MTRELFDAAWLDLREPVDHRSRAEALLAPLRAWWAVSRSSRVLDLGSGTGSNLRYLAPRLPGPQRWTLVDHDPALLAHATPPRAEVEVRAVEGDLAEAGLEEVAGAELVTASAVLDLVSRRWLEELVEACTAERRAVLFALTYDGVIEWGDARGEGSPGPDPDDALVRDAVAEHQHRDKGVGPALGPEAGHAVADAFRARGYRTTVAPSPWRLRAGDRALAARLLAGWTEAATEQRPSERDRIEAWAARRRATIAGDRLDLTVGHLDVLALPDAGPRR